MLYAFTVPNDMRTFMLARRANSSLKKTSKMLKKGDVVFMTHTKRVFQFEEYDGAIQLVLNMRCGGSVFYLLVEDLSLFAKQCVCQWMLACLNRMSKENKEARSEAINTMRLMERELSKHIRGHRQPILTVVAGLDFSEKREREAARHLPVKIPR